MANDIKFGLSAPMPGADLDGLVDFSVVAEELGFDWACICGALSARDGWLTW